MFFEIVKIKTEDKHKSFKTKRGENNSTKEHIHYLDIAHKFEHLQLENIDMNNIYVSNNNELKSICPISKEVLQNLYKIDKLDNSLFNKIKEILYDDNVDMEEKPKLYEKYLINKLETRSDLTLNYFYNNKHEKLVLTGIEEILIYKSWSDLADNIISAKNTISTQNKGYYLIKPCISNFCLIDYGILDQLGQLFLIQITININSHSKFNEILEEKDTKLKDISSPIIADAVFQYKRLKEIFKNKIYLAWLGPKPNKMKNDIVYFDVAMNDFFEL